MKTGTDEIHQPYKVGDKDRFWRSGRFSNSRY